MSGVADTEALGILKALNVPLLNPEMIAEIRLPHHEEAVAKLKLFIQGGLQRAYRQLVDSIETSVFTKIYYRIYTAAKEQVYAALAELGRVIDDLVAWIGDVLSEANPVKAMFHDADTWFELQGIFSSVAAGLDRNNIGKDPDNPDPDATTSPLRYFGTQGNNSRWSGRFAQVYMTELTNQQLAARHYATLAGSTGTILTDLAKLGAAFFASIATMVVQLAMGMLQGRGAAKWGLKSLPFIGRFFRQPDPASEIRTLTRVGVSTFALWYVIGKENQGKGILLGNLLANTDGLGGAKNWPDPRKHPSFPEVQPDGTIRAGAPGRVNDMRRPR